jgi:site-specific recombinase XerD
MTDTAISPLRRRMIEDMTIRQLKPTTQHNNIRFVKEFSIFFGRSPDKAAFEDVRRYQLHLTSRGVSPGSINGALAALKFFFRITVQRFDIANHIELVRQPRRLPVVLSPEEVTRLLEAARGPKGGIGGGLWGWPTDIGDRLAQSFGHRQQADGDPCRAR